MLSLLSSLVLQSSNFSCSVNLTEIGCIARGNFEAELLQLDDHRMRRVLGEPLLKSFAEQEELSDCARPALFVEEN